MKWLGWRIWNYFLNSYSLFLDIIFEFRAYIYKDQIQKL